MLDEQTIKSVVKYCRSKEFKERDLLEKCVDYVSSEMKLQLLSNIVCKISYDKMDYRGEIYCDRKWFYTLRNRALTLFYYRSTGYAEYFKRIQTNLSGNKSKRDKNNDKGNTEP